MSKRPPSNVLAILERIRVFIMKLKMAYDSITLTIDNIPVPAFNPGPFKHVHEVNDIQAACDHRAMVNYSYGPFDVYTCITCGYSRCLTPFGKPKGARLLNNDGHWEQVQLGSECVGLVREDNIPEEVKVFSTYAAAGPAKEETSLYVVKC